MRLTFAPQLSVLVLAGAALAGCGGGGGSSGGSASAVAASTSGTTATPTSSSGAPTTSAGAPTTSAPVATVPPTAASVTPTTVWNDAPTTLVVRGTGFVGALQVRLVDPAGVAPVVTATGVVARSATELEATVPGGAAPGARQVVVVNAVGASPTAGAPTVTVVNGLDPDLGGGHAVGWLDVQLAGASGDRPAMRIYYPALAAPAPAGAPVDRSRGPYPIVAYGHGFRPPIVTFGIDHRTNGFVAAWLASYGLVVACPDLSTNNRLFGSSATGQANSERDADDLVAVLDDLTRRGADPQDPLFGMIDGTRAALGGHSRGGDGALIAAAREATRAPRRLRAAFAFGPPGTDSRNGNAPLVFGDLSTVPVLLVGASRDAIAPVPDQEGILARTGAKGLVLEVIGGSHSLYKDNNSTIWGDGTPVISIDDQHAVVRRYATAWVGQLVRGQGSLAAPWLPGGAVAATDTRVRVVADTR